MDRKIVFLTTFIFIFTLAVTLPQYALAANLQPITNNNINSGTKLNIDKLDPQPEPPAPEINTGLIINRPPLDMLDPQPEPPMSDIGTNIIIKRPPLDALDPQPEPPMTDGANISITPPSLDKLDPQPEPPMIANDINILLNNIPLNRLDPQPEPPMIANDINILLNNIPLNRLDPQPEPPMLYQNRTLVPMRVIFENLGATVDWDGNTKTITAKKGNIEIIIKPGEGSAIINGKTESLDVPALIYNDRTFVPLRFVSQALGYNVEWNEQTRTVSITS